MKPSNAHLEAIEEHAQLNTRGALGSSNFIAFLLAVLLGCVGVLALQYLAELNGHAGSRADIMSVTWCTFVAAMLLNTLFKSSR